MKQFSIFFLKLGLIIYWSSIMNSFIAYSQSTLPTGFVDVQEVIPSILVDLKYLGSDNFVGRPIPGYNTSRVILSKEATSALANIQTELQQFGLSLLIYDAYRPTQAVDAFVAWSNEPEDKTIKQKYYPTLTKKEIFDQRYIMKKSSHSRGSTVDLTIVSLNNTQNQHNTLYIPLDMGGIFDFFGKESHPNFQNITPQQKANRLFLRTIMTKYGFTPISNEWWHFTLAKEPFPETYFNFPIE